MAVSGFGKSEGNQDLGNEAMVPGPALQPTGLGPGLRPIGIQASGL